MGEEIEPIFASYEQRCEAGTEVGFPIPSYARGFFVQVSQSTSLQSSSVLMVFFEFFKRPIIPLMTVHGVLYLVSSFFKHSTALTQLHLCIV